MKRIPFGAARAAPFHLQALCDETARALRALGYDVPAYTLWTAALPRGVLARTITRPIDRQSVRHDIVFARALIRIQSQGQVIKSICAHELLHTCRPEDGHGGFWADAAKRVSEELGLDVRETPDPSWLGFLDDPSSKRYLFRCAKCGKEIGYERLTKTARALTEKHPNGMPKYRHRGCGGTWVRVR